MKAMASAAEAAIEQIDKRRVVLGIMLCLGAGGYFVFRS
jgi:hypothetical protein